MDLMPYVAQLRHELAVAADAGGDEARGLAQRLTAPLESAARLCLLDALAAAAEEITRELAPGSVEVRLRGREPDFVVSLPPEHEPDDIASRPTSPVLSPPADNDDGGTARITLRLPEQLKPRIEQAAGREGLSVNAWLVRAVTTAVDHDDRAGRGERRGMQLGRHFTGWAR